LWCPNALLPEGLAVLEAWGFAYKSNLVWHKVRKDGGSDGRGVGFYFRNVTELILFGVRGKNARTLAPGRRQVNLLASRKREHSRKPDEQYEIIESWSPGPYIELFARGTRSGWASWGNQADDRYRPTWKTYAYHSQVYPVAADWGDCSSSLSALAPSSIKCLTSSTSSPNVTIEAGRPINTSGQGLPTPLLIRSSSLRQCVVAAPNLSETN